MLDAVIDGSAENIPMPDSCVDVVISNGVLNLVPDKRRAIIDRRSLDTVTSIRWPGLEKAGSSAVMITALFGRRYRREVAPTWREATS